MRTVSRSRVAKWPDIGATTSTLGCAAPPSLRKRSRVANGVTSTASSIDRHRLAADDDALDLPGRPPVGHLGQLEHLAGGGGLAMHRRRLRASDSRKGSDSRERVRTGHIRSLWVWYAWYIMGSDALWLCAGASNLCASAGTDAFDRGTAIAS